MRSALDIARYVIWYCGRHGFAISNLKLQKMLYFIQAEFLVETGSPCFFEDIEAWDFGPVVPEVYREYKIFGSSDIPTFIVNRRVSLRSNEMDLINGMVDECSQYTASQLVEITHSQEPWRVAYNRGRNRVISNDSIREYFSDI
jgi:uncharacterized phage-associated protein